MPLSAQSYPPACWWCSASYDWEGTRPTRSKTIFAYFWIGFSNFLLNYGSSQTHVIYVAGLSWRRGKRQDRMGKNWIGSWSKLLFMDPLPLSPSPFLPCNSPSRSILYSRCMSEKDAWLELTLRYPSSLHNGIGRGNVPHFSHFSHSRKTPSRFLTYVKS